MLQEAADENTSSLSGYQAMVKIIKIICKPIYKLICFYVKERNDTTT